MSDKITITRALAELKLLDARIKKEIHQCTFVDGFQERKDLTIFSKITKSEFENLANSRFQSIKDLIYRRNKIKSGILISNSKTTVKIGDEDYLVVEAIDKKNAIEYDKILLQKMKVDLSELNNNIDNNDAGLKNQIQTLVENSLGTEKKIEKDDYEKIANPILKQNEIQKIDPIKIEKVIAELDKNIDTFLGEVDFVLSESNSKTEIKV